LTKLETSIEKTKGDLEKARTETLTSLRKRRDEAVSARRARQEQVADAAGKMKTYAEQKKHETDATVEGWVRERKVDMLEHRADDAEEYAITAADMVDAAEEEAWAATLEAVEARRVADEAKESSGKG
jgi:vacuolar-type H+-ATPase subunit I/STV1